MDIKLDENERLPKRRTLNKKLDDEYINSIMKKILETCLDRSMSNLANKKSDLSFRILEVFATNSGEIENFDKVASHLTTLLDKVQKI